MANEPNTQPSVYTTKGFARDAVFSVVNDSIAQTPSKQSAADVIEFVLGKDWSGLSPEQRLVEAEKNRAYAAKIITVQHPEWNVAGLPSGAKLRRQEGTVFLTSPASDTVATPAERKLEGFPSSPPSQEHAQVARLIAQRAAGKPPVLPTKAPATNQEDYIDTGFSNHISPEAYQDAYEKMIAKVTGTASESAQQEPNNFFATSLPIGSITPYTYKKRDRPSVFDKHAGTPRTPAEPDDQNVALVVNPPPNATPTPQTPNTTAQPAAQPAAQPTSTAPAARSPRMASSVPSNGQFSRHHLDQLKMFEDYLAKTHGWNVVHHDYNDAHAGRTYWMPAIPANGKQPAQQERKIFSVKPDGIEMHYPLINPKTGNITQEMAIAIHLAVKMHKGNFQSTNMPPETIKKIEAHLIESIAKGTLKDNEGKPLKSVVFNNKSYPDPIAPAATATQQTSPPPAFLGQSPLRAGAPLGAPDNKSNTTSAPPPQKSLWQRIRGPGAG